MLRLATLAAGALLTLGVAAGSSQAAPLSHSIASPADANAGLVEKTHHRHWHRGGHGRHYGWYGPPRRYGYYRPGPRYYYGPPRYRNYGYYRPRPRAGIYFGFGAPGYW